MNPRAPEICVFCGSSFLLFGHVLKNIFFSKSQKIQKTTTKNKQAKKKKRDPIIHPLVENLLFPRGTLF